MKLTYKIYQNILAGKRRKIADNRILGRSLAVIAGAINAGGFMVVGQYTSHMTGIISLAADNIALSHWVVVLSMFFYIFCFIFGATITTILVIWGRDNNLHSSYALPIAIEALLLICFGVVNGFYLPDESSNWFFVIALLCFLMGLQNALITKITDTTIRTTHITGMATDIGIEIGRVVYFVIGKDITNWQYNKERIILYISIILSFLIGGIAGAYSFKYIGSGFVFPLAAYLIFIAFYPMRRDFLIWKYLRDRR